MNWDLFGSGSRDAAAPSKSQRPAAPSDQVRPLTVAGLTALAKGLLESAYPPLWVGGEVTGWKRHSASGHCYFCLRDKRAQVRCVMFRADAERLPTEPTEGMAVRALGTLTLFEKRGEFQFMVKVLEGVGAGGLWRLAFEKLRTKLEGEGLLSQERKRALPRFPATVGVVTSPFGAALHDVLHVIERRAPWTRVVFAPVRVQGEGAALDVARAIRLFERARVAEVLIIGRGGGAAEDLWAFNEEVVARAIASSRIPVVSAVGHEVDVTIADLVADARAPTPSAAAERVVPDGAVIRRELRAAETRLGNALRRRVRMVRSSLDGYERDLQSLMRSRLRDRREQLARLAGTLEALSPLAALRRGYAVPLDQSGTVLRGVSDFASADHFELRVVDGTIDCQVSSTRPDPIDSSRTET
jgi:exodeoxyribonuclease VII large subunit